MQDYSKYEVKDFLNDEAFCRWVLRYENSDVIFWENWLTKNPDRTAIVLAAKQLVLDVRSAQNYISEEDFEKELGRISMARNQEPVKRFIEEERVVRVNWKYLVALAAMLGSVVFYFNYFPKNTQNIPYHTFLNKNQLLKNELVEIVNKDAQPKEIRLEDGSLVVLAPKSKLSYPTKFAENNREVFLNGEAFFDISKNPLRPFKVFSQDIVTTVLGTSFTISDFDDGSPIKVVVKTGKVTVATASKSKEVSVAQHDEIILLPNQQVVFNRDEPKLKRTLVEVPQLLMVPEKVEQITKFERSPVATIFEDLEKSYGVQIVYDSEVLAGCELTAEFGQEPLFDKIGMICKAIQGRYEIIDGQIIIYGASCGAKKL